ncbi:hypothetical protein E4T56_gene11493 [Termitomyces sp. T112]|nr:hypothetical protein E4T56_gene11493 [Termitomyces sp. T112]
MSCFWALLCGVVPLPEQSPTLKYFDGILACSQFEWDRRSSLDRHVRLVTLTAGVLGVNRVALLCRFCFIEILSSKWRNGLEFERADYSGIQYQYHLRRQGYFVISITCVGICKVVVVVVFLFALQSTGTLHQCERIYFICLELP